MFSRVTTVAAVVVVVVVVVVVFTLNLFSILSFFIFVTF